MGEDGYQKGDGTAKGTVNNRKCGGERVKEERQSTEA
jgi:hypothetical protein